MSMIRIFLLVAIFVTAPNAFVSLSPEKYVNDVVLPEITSIINEVKSQSNDVDVIFLELQSSVTRDNHMFYFTFRDEFLKTVKGITTMIKTHLVKKDVHVNITECTQLIVPFAETLINIENNLTICLKNEIKNGTHYRNFIDDAVEHTLDILKGIKNKALFCPQGIEYNFTGLQCAVQATEEAHATERKLYNEISNYTAQLNFSIQSNFHNCIYRSHFSDVPIETTNIIDESEQCIKKKINEALNRNGNSHTVETVMEPIDDGFYSSMSLATFVQQIVDLSITPIIHQIQEISKEAHTSIDELRETTTKYNNTFYHDTEMFLQELRNDIDVMKEKVRPYKTECDVVAENIVEDAFYAKCNFTDCINKNFTTGAAYHDLIIIDIRDLLGYLNVMKKEALLQSDNNNFEMAVARASEVLLQANVVAGKYINAISTMINKIDFLVASIPSSSRNCQENTLQNLADQNLKRMNQCVQNSFGGSN